MTRCNTILMRTVLAGSALALAGCVDGGRQMTLEEAPPQVRQAALAEAEGGVIREVEWVAQDEVYHVEYDRADAEWEIHIDENGRILGRFRDGGAVH